MDSNAYKAFRIVILHWIIPSIQERKYKASTKICRWWVRISGSHRGFNLIKPYRNIRESFPPGLWRQTHTCTDRIYINKIRYCRTFYKRWEKEIVSNCIKTLNIRNYLIRNSHRIVRDSELINKFGNDNVEVYYNNWLVDNCACNMITPNVVIDYKEKYNSLEHILRIMAHDRITTKTRSLVSKYLQNRLKPM